MDCGTRGGCDNGTVGARHAQWLDKFRGYSLYPAVPVVSGANYCIGSDYDLCHLWLGRVGENLRAYLNIYIADNFILGADDSIPNDSDPERVRALVDYVHSWRQTHQN